MIREFEAVTEDVNQCLEMWTTKLLHLSVKTIKTPRNVQHRNIKQILGHMIDSVSNNTHRVVHLQYRESPCDFPNYATYGNNDRWISIQNYEEENWEDMVYLWKFSHRHFIHLIKHINVEKLENEWLTDPSGSTVTLKEMIIDFLPHFHLHIGELESLID